MDISVIISVHVRPRLLGWTVGPCPHCKAMTAVAVDELVRMVSIYFVPIFRSVDGIQRRCDFCDRVLAEGRPDAIVPRSDWQPSKGLFRLAQVAGISLPTDPVDQNAMIHSLLGAATERSQLDVLDISFGLTTGCIIGAAVGAPAAWYLLSGILWQMDDLGRVFFGLLGGLTLGGVIDGTIAAFVRRRSIPIAAIRRAIENYCSDPDEIVAAAESYPRRIRRAAARARDATRFGVSLTSARRG